MRYVIPAILCMLPGFAWAQAAAPRPIVPWRVATVKAPMRPLATKAESAKATEVKPVKIAAAQTKIAQAKPIKIAVARVKIAQVKPVEPEIVSEAGFVRMILTAEDDTALRTTLIDMGLVLRKDGEKARELPPFLTGIHYNQSLRSRGKEIGDLPKIDTAGAARVVRYIAGSDSAVAYVNSHADERFVVVVDIHNLSAATLKSLAGDNIVAVIVGHYHAADLKPGQFAKHAQDVMGVTRAIRLVSDAPVLLAVSASNWFTKRPDAGWVKAFAATVASYDGWAIYNLHNWAAILEAPSNPREAALKALGLPDKPCILLDFLGTPSQFPPSRAAYMRAVWKAKAPLLFKALKKQAWRGVIFYTTRLADAQLKTGYMKAK